VTQLNTVEAMEFHNDTIRATALNRDFLDSMSQ